MSTGKLSSRACLQVPLESRRRFLVVELDQHQLPPGTISGGMRRQSRVVRGEPRHGIRRESDVGHARIVDACQDVNESLWLTHDLTAARSRPPSASEFGRPLEPSGRTSLNRQQSWGRSQCRFCDSALLANAVGAPADKPGGVHVAEIEPIEVAGLASRDLSSATGKPAYPLRAPRLRPSRAIESRRLASRSLSSATREPAYAPRTRRLRRAAFACDRERRLVSREGIEPSTRRLRVCCSAN